MVASVAGDAAGRPADPRAAVPQPASFGLDGGADRRRAARRGRARSASRISACCSSTSLPEFQRPVLDSLRQPLETGKVSVARANAHVTFPARVQPVLHVV